MRLYRELANWWPLFSAPADYADEAVAFLPLLAGTRTGATADAAAARDRPTLLELGSGGGNLASHLAPHFALTLCDISPEMLAVSRALNPGAEHVAGDMRTLRLGRTFDAVLIHDAIMYMTSTEYLLAALRTAAVHCRENGVVVVAPDFVRESFSATTSHGGEDADDGRAVRYLEWMHDPDPDDDTVEALYIVVTRDAAGRINVVQDVHVEGCFPRDTWLQLFAEAGLHARIEVDQWNRPVFVSRPLVAR